MSDLSIPLHDRLKRRRTSCGVLKETDNIDQHNSPKPARKNSSKKIIPQKAKKTPPEPEPVLKLTVLDKEKNGESVENTYELTYQEEKALVGRIRRDRHDATIVVPEDDEEESEEGSLVWARWHANIYPAMVVAGRSVHLRAPALGRNWVYWFAEGKVSEVPAENVFPLDTIELIKELKRKNIKNNSMMSTGLKVLYDELEARCRAKKCDFPLRKKRKAAFDPRKFLDNIHKIKGCIGSQAFCSTSVLEKLRVLTEKHRKSYEKLLMEELLDDSDDDDDASSDEENLPPRLTNEEMSELFAGVRKGDTHLKGVCLACGSLMNLNNEHPIFSGKVCDECCKHLIEGGFAVAENGEFLFCAICSRGGEVVICGNAQCKRAYCKTCLQLLVEDCAWVLITSLDSWRCYLCDKKQPMGVLEVRPDWKQRLCHLYQPKKIPKEMTNFSPNFRRRPIKVISLFDGIGTGAVALSSAGLSVGRYFAYEIDEEAILVARSRHGNCIEHCGDVKSITPEALERLMPVDLLIGGSPCNDLSVANPKRKGLQGGTGVLFYEFYRVLEELQKLCVGRKHHLFWLFENVASMRAEDKDRISRFFGRDPILLDAGKFTAQRRPRYFWGNLPGMYTEALELSKDWLTKQNIEECLETRAGRSSRVQRICTVTTRTHSGRGKKGSLPIAMDGKLDSLWICELERIFGLPAHYTDCNLSLTARRRLVGKAWSVPVIANLLRPLNQFYETEATQ